MKTPWKRLQLWLNQQRRRQSEWQDEIESHLAMRTEWKQAEGLPANEARQAAARQFGNRLHALEEVRSIHVRKWFDDLLQDFRLAVRGFRKSPTVAAVAIATIAIGVGASTAIFGVVDPLLFRSLPYPHDDQLVSVGYFGPVDNNEFNVVSSYLDWRRQQGVFQDLTAMRPGAQCDLMAGQTPFRVTCYAVEANFLRTLGIAPALGHDFTTEDDQPHAPPVVLLSFSIWRNRFGGDARIIGQSVIVNEEPARVAGILPQGFEMPQTGLPDILMPARLDGARPRAANSSSFLRTFGRLRQGVSIEQARDRMLPLYQQTMQLDVPKELRSEARFVIRSLRDRQIHDVKLASWMLLCAVLALLLLVCANVANLLLARAAARRREMAVRVAIGAGRGRLIRQMLTESLALALTGGVAGCGVAWALMRALVAMAPEGLLRVDRTGVDARVLLFALTASFVAALLFGMAPALERPRAEALAGARVAGTARTLSRKLLVAVQVAISLVLLTGASLFLRSFWKLQSAPLGFESEHLVTASFTLRPQRYRSGNAQSAFCHQLEARLKSIPGSGSFAMSDSIPPRGSMGRPYSNLRIAGNRPVAPDGGMVEFRWVTPGYFHTMGIPVTAGRAFTEDERASGESPVILSATLARRLFGAENPVGQQIDFEQDGRWCSIVGVAADTRNNGLTQTDPEYYRLRMDNLAPQQGAVALFRTSVSPAALARSIRQEVAQVDPSLPVTIETMEQRVGRFREQPRFVASLVALFAGFGVLLAAVGLYGVLSFLVAQQTQEIGIRMALGARPSDIAMHIQGYAGVWTGIGVAAGVACSLAVTRMVKGLLFGIAPDDAWSLIAAIAVLALTAVLAAWIPSRRAARVDPVVALRWGG
jgi:putative ABC transport system permease protein